MFGSYRGIYPKKSSGEVLNMSRLGNSNVSHVKFTLWSLIVYFLLAVLLMGGHDVHGDQDISTKQNHFATSDLVFFSPNDLIPGKILPVCFRASIHSRPSSPRFLSREEARLIPFSPSNLNYVLQHFGFGRDSSMAKAMEATLQACDKSPNQEEIKFCATSLESTVDYAHEILGSTTKVQALSTRKPTKSGDNVLKNYTIVDQPKEIMAPKMVPCHLMPYPYVIYFCHHLQSESSKVYQVTLRSSSADDGSKSNDDDNVGFEAVTVCHLDTSQWNPDHVSFHILGIKSGSSPVCHIFPPDDLVWVPLYSKTNNEGILYDKVSVL